MPNRMVAQMFSAKVRLTPHEMSVPMMHAIFDERPQRTAKKEPYDHHLTSIRLVHEGVNSLQAGDIGTPT